MALLYAATEADSGELSSSIEGRAASVNPAYMRIAAISSPMYRKSPTPSRVRVLAEAISMAPRAINTLPKARFGSTPFLKNSQDDQRARRYAVFLGASAFFVFMQNAVMEPFGGDVFGLPVGETTRFNAFWGSGVLLGMVVTILFTRRWRPDQQIGTTMWGLGLLAIPLFALGGSAWTANLAMVRPLLVLFGLGVGIFAVGGVSLLMAMSVEAQAAAYLALWSVIQLVSRGAGIAAGGLLRDAALAATGSFASTYGLVFWVEALGALACIWLLRRADVAGFVSKTGRVEASEPIGVTAD